jgi:hypothetical protein
MITATLLALSLLAPPGDAVTAAPPPVVATHYFYWYRWPDQHFDQPGAPGREGHRRHLPEPEKVSYLSADWHAAQFRAMAGCGIDIALPVYWGAPGAYEKPGVRFSVDGLGPMVQALDEIDGKKIALGLFYDTSTLLRSVRGLSSGDDQPDRPDLTKLAGRRLFCNTVVEYFERIPKRHWGRLDGKPLVVLYVSGFAGKWDETLGGSLREAFERRFPGEYPLLVADASWGEIGQDLTTSWGAALHEPKLFDGVAQIGAGYDDSPVPGRRTPIRERDGGDFYRWSWQQAVLAEPRLVVIETWNEMHEGTEICETVEAGRLYLELTEEWIDRLRRKDPGPPIPAPGPLKLRPDKSWGKEAIGVPEVSADYASGGVARLGLREIAWQDGPLEVTEGALRSRGSSRDSISYLYFQISDHWVFDVEETFEITVTRDEPGEVWLQYDSHDPAAPLDGAYRSVRGSPKSAGDGKVTQFFELPAARLANRQNGGADFRLVVRGGEVAVHSVVVSRRK